MEVKIYSKEEKIAFIEEYEKSGMSTAQFAQKVGVSPRTVRYWYHTYGSSQPDAGSSVKMIDITDKVKPETVSFEMDGHRFTIDRRSLKAFTEELR